MTTVPASHLGFPVPRGDVATQSRVLEACVVLLVVLVIPLVMYVVHLAPLARIVYPVSNLALAGWLYARRSPWYAAHVLLVFCFVSLVRRLCDEQAGFDATNPILITPYLCCLFTGFAFVDYWLRRQPRYLGAFLLIVFAALYGGALAALGGRSIAGAVDSLKWIAGPLFAVYLIAQRDAQNVRPVVENTLLVAASAMSIYGIVQYVSPTTWDGAWMRSVLELGMDSIGGPDPFSLRVFSTMNSPGSCGAMLLAGIVVALKRPLLIAVPAIACMLVCLGLCQYRTIWAATALAMLMVFFSRPGSLRPSNLFAIFGVLVALSSTALIPEIRDAVVNRAVSMTELKSDSSGEERLAQYRDLAGNDSLIVGEGLGLSGSLRRLDGLPRTIIDSGLIDIWRALGVVVGTLFLAALISLVIRTMTSAPELAHHLDFDRALVVAVFIQLPMGSVHIGEMGFTGWLFLGLALAALAQKQVAK
jgi:hypothetical protein